MEAPRKTRRQRIERTPLRFWILLFLVVNAGPIAVFLWLAWRVEQGETSWEQALPPGLRAAAPPLCLGIVLLSLFAWLLVPFAVRSGAWVRGAIQRAGAPPRGARAMLLLPPLRLLEGLSHLLRGLAWLGAVGALLVIALFGWRLVQPDALEPLAAPIESLCRSLLEAL